LFNKSLMFDKLNFIVLLYKIIING